MWTQRSLIFHTDSSRDFLSKQFSSVKKFGFEKKKVMIEFLSEIWFLYFSLVLLQQQFGILMF